MKSSLIEKVKSYLVLSKIKIMIPVSLTGFAGYFIFKPLISLETTGVCAGIFFLAISASVLNQVQEVDLDSKMKRTHDRPIPAGKISINQALVYFLLTLITGSILLYISGNVTAVIIGIVTIAWYNGVYTNLKRITAFAVVPGAITGALPPLIGWVAAGGGILDKPIIFLQFLFFVGQVPHFWLLVLKYGEEYGKAGMPSLTNILSGPQINRLTFTWVVTSVISALFLCYFEIVRSNIIVGIILIASAIIVWQFSDLINMNENNSKLKKYSIFLDSYFLLILLLLIADRLIV